MIEMAFSALAKQCLHRRIASEQQLKEEIKAIVQERNDKNIKINWQFSLQTARSRMNACYRKVNEKIKNIKRLTLLYT